eukprot:scaffold10568_cov140-Skeletonema_dohrnii-CCMP3373.AAC.8
MLDEGVEQVHLGLREDSSCGWQSPHILDERGEQVQLGKILAKLVAKERSDRRHALIQNSGWFKEFGARTHWDKWTHLDKC